MNFHLIPNWSTDVIETYEFRTSIFTSRSGKEQRSAERLLPRRSVAFSTMVWDDGLRNFQLKLHDRGSLTISIPDPARYAATLNLDAPSGATFIVLDAAPPWLKSGMTLAISDVNQSEFRNGGTIIQVGSFSAAFDENDFDRTSRVRISLSAPLSRSWSRGAVVRPVIEGRMQQEVSLDYRSDTVATSAITLAILPPSQVPDLGAPAQQEFDGRPVLLASPNWTQPPTVEYDTRWEEVDYGRGVAKSYLPIEFHTRITQFNYAGRSRDVVGELLGTFVAMRGRQGEFYCPTWVSDMIASSGIAAGTSALTVARPTAANYESSSVNRAIGILLADGSWLFRKVLSIEVVNHPGPGAFNADYGLDFDGAGTGEFSRLTFDEPIESDLYRRDISMVCWLNVCRFASDTLSIRWATDDVAQVSAQIMTLEALAAE